MWNMYFDEGTSVFAKKYPEWKVRTKADDYQVYIDEFVRPMMRLDH
jgi:hypothetical protein